MKFLIPHWYTYGLEEITAIFQEKGHTVSPCPDTPRNYHYDPVFCRKITQTIAEQKIEAVFSLQFFPVLSNICEKLQIPYICWCYSDPINRLLLTESLANSCNIVFHTDSQWIVKLQRAGGQNIHYLPWAAGRESLSQNTLPPQSDISLADTTNQEAWLNYLTLSRQLDSRTRGFLDGLLQAQQSIYGFHFLEKVLHRQVLAAMQDAFPLKVIRNNTAPLEDLYAFQILYPALTHMETQHILKLLEKEKQWRVSTEENSNSVYSPGSIHILIPPREIQDGIPTQAMDIMGCGNFLLTGFQKDYFSFFEPDRDYVYYESPEDMIEKARYYLNHQKERRRIAENARKKILQEHTMAHRLREMFALLH